jgi:hypothetical protein
MIQKQEAQLKSAAMRELRRQCPSFVVQQFATNGSPDRSITGNGVTTMWEFKNGQPSFLSPRDQELMCMRLAAQGHCKYVVWQESRTGTGQRTMILHPRQVHERSGWAFVPEAWSVGFDHRWLAGQIRKAHGV